MNPVHINTAKAPRRILNLESFAALELELVRLENAERAGTLRYTGNFSAGPIFMHLALPIQYAIDGFPDMAPWPVRLLANKLLLPIIRRKPFSPGFRLGKKVQSKIWLEGLRFDDGLQALRHEMLRLDAGERMNKPHAFFGHMQHAEWATYNLKHADLHLGFLDPGDGL